MDKALCCKVLCVNSKPVWKNSPPPAGLALQAHENLRYIREVISRSVEFTAVPGWGMVGTGVTAILAYLLARRVAIETGLAIWVGEAFLAATLLGLATFRKAGRQGLLLRHKVSRRFLLNLAPPLVAGALLSGALWRSGQLEPIPGMWLLLYGTGVLTGGAFSVRPVPMMGLAFGFLGGLALLISPLYQNELLMLGFGGLHLAFGAFIARRHGG